MDNAVKYTPEGSAICLETEKKDGKVLVKVSDNGPGISENERSNIFEMFYNGKKDVSDSRRNMGKYRKRHCPPRVYPDSYRHRIQNDHR